MTDQNKQPAPSTIGFGSAVDILGKLCGDAIDRIGTALRRLCSAIQIAGDAIDCFSRQTDSWHDNMSAWLKRQWADAMKRRELPPPALALRASGSAWPVSVKAWQFQEARMRKGGRQS